MPTSVEQFGLYVQDYDGPIGFRIINRHPDWLEWHQMPRGAVQDNNATN